MNKNENIKIAIFAGGPSLEREISIKSAENIKNNLQKNFKNIITITVLENLDWVIDNKKIENKDDFLKNIDFAINYIHGEYGEDGKLQEIIEKNNIPYLGSSSDSLKNTIRKDITGKICEENNISTTSPLKITKKNFENFSLEEIFKTLKAEKVIIKPADGGSSFGVSVANNIKELQKSITDAFAVSDIIVVENFINGREFSCGVYFNTETKTNKALPVVEILYPEKEFFDYEAKYEGMSQEICPANINNSLSDEIKKISIQAFEATKCSDFARVDFLVDKNDKIFVIEINTIPGFTNESIFPKELRSENIDSADFLKSLIKYNLDK